MYVYVDAEQGRVRDTTERGQRASLAAQETLSASRSGLRGASAGSASCRDTGIALTAVAATEVRKMCAQQKIRRVTVIQP